MEKEPSQTASSCPDLELAEKAALELFQMWKEQPNVTLTPREMLREAWFRGYQAGKIKGREEGRLSQYVDMTTKKSETP